MNLMNWYQELLQQTICLWANASLRVSRKLVGWPRLHLPRTQFLRLQELTIAAFQQGEDSFAEHCHESLRGSKINHLGGILIAF